MKEMGVDPIDDWNQLRLPWFERTRYSPGVEPGFEGVSIWAPESVALGSSGGRVPVFGVVQLGAETLAELSIEDRHPLRAVVIGGIFEGVNEAQVGSAVLQAPLLATAPGAAPTEYFSVDLLECTDLPKGPGTIFVFASVGPFLAQPRKVVLAR
jgi:hypothetical protein